MNRKFVTIKHSMIEVGPTLMRKFLVDLHNAYVLRDELDSVIDEYIRSGKATILQNEPAPDTRKEEV